MYMNPTVQIHTAYELIEHLLELNTTKKKIRKLGSGDDTSVQLLSRKMKMEKVEKKKTQLKLVDIFKKQRENQMAQLKKEPPAPALEQPITKLVKQKTMIDSAATDPKNDMVTKAPLMIEEEKISVQDVDENDVSNEVVTQQQLIQGGKTSSESLIGVKSKTTKAPRHTSQSNLYKNALKTKSNETNEPKVVPD